MVQTAILIDLTFVNISLTSVTPSIHIKILNNIEGSLTLDGAQACRKTFADHVKSKSETHYNL